jgi:hypothetical protein
VLGYHGCEEAIGRQAVDGKIPILKSTRDFDWIGTGAYFWEADPTRAWEWAQQKKARKEYDKPFVIGAVIDLRNCLDLMNRDHAELVRKAYDSYKTMRTKSQLPLPVNSPAPQDKSEDLVMRRLDCAVINHLHSIMQDGGEPPFDTVRALLPEGKPLYDGSGLRDKTHVQIAVCNLDCIASVFHVKGPWSPA